LVSHDIGEIFRLANQVLIMENGQIIRTGTPIEVFAEGNKTLTGLVIEVDEERNFVAILIGNQVVRKQLENTFEVGDEIEMSVFLK